MAIGAKNKIYSALVHHPVLDKNGEEITAAVTNLDIHDLARLAKTYGLKNFYIVTPDQNQKDLAREIIDHWINGFGATYNKDRKEAMEVVRIINSIEDMEKEVLRETGKKPLLVSTSASRMKNSITFAELKKRFSQEDRDLIVIFGTGWGLSREVIERSDFVLEPIDIMKGYNHLSVRSAASIVIDRLLN